MSTAWPISISSTAAPNAPQRSLRGRGHRIVLLSLVIAIIGIMVSPAGAVLSADFGGSPAKLVSAPPAASPTARSAILSSPSVLSPSALSPTVSSSFGLSSVHGPQPASSVLLPRSLSRPADGSTAQNSLLFNLSYSSVNTQIGTTNTSMETAMYSWNSLANGSSLTGWDPGFLPSASFFHSGTVEFSRTVGGVTTFATPPANASWHQSGSAVYGSIFGAGNSLFNPAFAVPGAEPLSIASNDTGTLLLAGLFTQACGVLPPTNISACNNTANITAPQGVAVSRSVDGGVNWIQTADVTQWKPFDFIDVPAPVGDPNCVGGSPAVGYLPGNSTYGSPAVVLSPVSGDATVAWNEYQVNFGGKFFWSATSGTCQLYVNPAFTQFFTYTSTTTNGGITWSTPVQHGLNQTLFPSLSLGPAPAYKVYLTALNGSVTITAASGFATSLAVSTTNGSTWSAMKNVAGMGVFLVKSLPDDTVNYQVTPVYSLAVDTASSSANYGAIYMVWGDNRSFSAIGEPSVEFSRSTNGGSSWSTGTYLTPNMTGVESYADPHIAVDSQGTIWVTFYAASSSSGQYYEEGMYSTNGGSSWSPMFQISDQVSLTGATGFADFGPNTGLEATTNGMYATWSDCRDVTCTNLNEQIFSANVHLVGVSSNISGFNVSVSSIAGTVTVSSAGGGAAILNGSSVRVSAPQYAPDNATYVYQFVDWSGVVSSTQDPATFTYNGLGDSLKALYLPEPAAFITGFVGPDVPSLQVTVGGTTVALQAHNQTAQFYNETVPAGPTYVVTVSAGIYYQTYTKTVPTSRFGVVVVSVILPRTTGWINGTVTPARANVTINGTAATMIAPGVFSQVVPWGTYAIEGLLAGYTPFFTNLSVTPHQTTPVTVTVVGGFIQVSVVPVDAIVQVDGVTQTVNAGSFTTAQLPGGTHLVTATAPGYNLYKRDVVVNPGRTVSITIKLTNEGWINGTIAPTSGHIQINQQYEVVNPSTGAFNVTEPAGKSLYNVTGSAAGYQSLSYTTVAVSPGNGTSVPFVLEKSVPATNCSSTNTCPPAHTNGTGTNGGISAIYLYAAIAVIVILVAAVAVVLLSRRGGAGPSTAGASGSSSSTPSSTYDGSSPSELPKMQSDGSMDSPSTPDGGSPPA